MAAHVAAQRAGLPVPTLANWASMAGMRRRYTEQAATGGGCRLVMAWTGPNETAAPETLGSWARRAPAGLPRGTAVQRSPRPACPARRGGVGASVNTVASMRSATGALKFPALLGWGKHHEFPFISP
eukprot:313084-Chlamydomonas_euryale.AAC.1